MFWGVQTIIILLCAHLILWHGEPEGFWEIFAVKGFLGQYAIHVAAFFVLAGVLEFLHHLEFRKGGRQWLIPRHYAFYAIKTILLPICLALLFGYFYFQGFGVAFDGLRYIQRVLPFYLVVLLLLNLIVFIRRLLIRMAWSLVNKTGQEAMLTGYGTGAEASRLTMMDGAYDEKTIELYVNRDRMNVPITDLVYSCIENRSIRVYLRNGKVGRYHGTLTRLKDDVGDDPRIFATGQWIVNGLDVDKIEDTFSRKKLIKLDFPFEATLPLPKEKVSEFRHWLEAVRSQDGRS